MLVSDLSSQPCYLINMFDVLLKISQGSYLRAKEGDRARVRYALNVCSSMSQILTGLTAALQAFFFFFNYL